MTRARRLSRGVGVGARYAMTAAALGLALGATVACTAESGATEAFCRQVAEVPVISDRDELSLPDAASTTTALRRELDELRSVAPSDLRGDVDTLATVTDALHRALTDPDGDARHDARAEIERRRDDWSEASSRIVSYTRRTCGIDLPTYR